MSNFGLLVSVFNVLSLTFICFLFLLFEVQELLITYDRIDGICCSVHLFLYIFVPNPI